MKRPRNEWKDFDEQNGSDDIFKPISHSLLSSSVEISSAKDFSNGSSRVMQSFGTAIATSASSPSSKNSTPNNAPRDALRSAMAGAMAGIFSRTMTAPIERVKLMLQLQRVSPIACTSSLSPSKPNHRNNQSAWQVFHQIYSTEGGLRAFWRGNSPNIIRQAGASALNFMFMDGYKAIISPIMNSTLAFPSNRSNATRKKRRAIMSAFLSGGLAGGSTTTFLYPFEFMRTRLALDVGPSRMYPRGMRDVFLKICNTDGIRGMYQGYGIALTGVVIYRALHLGGYDACKTELLHRRGDVSDSMNDQDKKIKISIGEQFAIAQIVSITAGTLCYPIDSVRRRLMMQAGQPVDARQYVNSVDAFRKILTKEGVKGFYLGLGPNIVRSIAGALLLVSYDIFRDGLNP